MAHPGVSLSQLPPAKRRCVSETHPRVQPTGQVRAHGLSEDSDKQVGPPTHAVAPVSRQQNAAVCSRGTQDAPLLHAEHTAALADMGYSADRAARVSPYPLC
jgi:hypothetical protein